MFQHIYTKKILFVDMYYHCLVTFGTYKKHFLFCLFQLFKTFSVNNAILLHK